MSRYTRREGQALNAICHQYSGRELFERLVDLMHHTRLTAINATLETLAAREAVCGGISLHNTSTEDLRADVLENLQLHYQTC